MPAALLLCLSFLHVPGRARQDTGPGAGSAAWAPTARCGHQPLPSTPGLPAAARPSRRHVLSPEECAKSLPDVHDGRTTAPSVALQGGQWALGTLQHPPGAEPVPGRILPGHRAQTQPVPQHRDAEVWQGTGSRAGRTLGCQGVNRRCHRGRAVSPCPHPTRPRSPRPEWGPALAQRGCAGSCPAPRALVPGRRAAERNGAVRWNLGAGGDGAAGGGRARHVAAYVRRVQGRTGRRPGRQGHRRGDAGPPPHTRRRVRGQTRTPRAARGTDGHCPAPWARHVCARARGRGHTCAKVGGQGPAGPLVSPCCWCPG